MTIKQLIMRGRIPFDVALPKDELSMYFIEEELNQIKYSKEFKKSLKKMVKQGKDIDKILNVVRLLSKKDKLDLKYRDYSLLTNKRFKNCRDCHVESDWILIYKYLDDSLLLINTGSHSDLF